MGGILFDLSINDEEEDGDCTPCSVCKEPIYGRKHTMNLEIEGEKLELESVICASCYSELHPD